MLFWALNINCKTGNVHVCFLRQENQEREQWFMEDKKKKKEDKKKREAPQKVTGSLPLMI